ncbi:MAG: hypothetical protein WBL63_23875 [Candidatus Acidiferrum sp.]
MGIITSYLILQSSWHGWLLAAAMFLAVYGISGHKTRSIFDRYNIVDESDLADAANRIERGAIEESGHSTGTADQTTQGDRVQQDVKPQYNQ